MLEARCPGCGSVYSGASLPFLYADEHGPRCSGCGSVLVVGDGGLREEAPTSYRLVLSEGLAGSGLHEKLAGLVGGWERLWLTVDRTGETRTVRLEPSAVSER